jgi:hypothetical protein
VIFLENATSLRTPYVKSITVTNTPSHEQNNLHLGIASILTIMLRDHVVPPIKRVQVVLVGVTLLMLACFGKLVPAVRRWRIAAIG